MTSSIPGAATSGLIPPPKASPCEENGAIAVRLLVRAPAGRAQADGDVDAAGERRPERGSSLVRDPDDRHVELVVEAQRAGRDDAVDDDRGGAGEHGRARLVGRA